MRIITVRVKRHGSVIVTWAIDEAGNQRLIPIGGAATLEQWRADSTLLPPWLLADDLEEPGTFAAIVQFLREGEE